jgi:hypothetical protein
MQATHRRTRVAADTAVRPAAADEDTPRSRASCPPRDLAADVAFEVDELEAEHATSVILPGRARRLEEDEEHRAENVPLRPWVATPKWNVVEIEVTEISGRGFDMTRPWQHLMVDDT